MSDTYLRDSREVYNSERLHLSLAGSGNPWVVITPLRKGLLRALHDRASLTDIKTKFGLSSDDVKKELTPLIDVNLVIKRGEKYLPTFLIADASETRRVTNHAKTIGRSLAEPLIKFWPKIETAYLKLSLSSKYSLHDLGFMLVGGQILDIGLLDALTRDGTLITPAPSRPSPDKPKARYYFWMIEGDLRDLGRYGMDETDLPWSNWYFITFGQNVINGTRNTDRDAIEEACSNLVKTNVVATPESLAKRLKVPVFRREDTSIWSKVTKECTGDLVKVYLEYDQILRQLFSTLQASIYAPPSFAEFFCWYDHVAYAWAINELETNDLISIPTQRFTAALWHCANQARGVL